MKNQPPMIVMMGVSGSGKTTAGRALAARLGVVFEEGDDLHPAANIAKMRAGMPLDDADRAPWLDSVAGWITAHIEGGGVVACSALKHAYRDRLRGAGYNSLGFVLLDIDDVAARARVGNRQGHFMPASLVDSQFRTLEPPVGEADVLVIDAAQSVDALLAAILGWIEKRIA